MAAAKPTIVKIIQTQLEEKTPPQEGEYEFVETYPPAEKSKTVLKE